MPTELPTFQNYLTWRIVVRVVLKKFLSFIIKFPFLFNIGGANDLFIFTMADIDPYPLERSEEASVELTYYSSKTHKFIKL